MKKIKKEIKTAIIYTRVSSKDQLEGFSLESQEKVCRAFADKNGLEVMKVFKEEGESAKTADRTQLKIMLKYADKNRNKIGALIVYKIDRLARSKTDYFALKMIFVKFGIIIQSATEPIEDDPSGKLMEGVLAALAEFDNDIRAQRTSEGMKTRLKNGYWGWRAQIGYKNVKDTLGNKIIAPDPIKAPLVREIFEEYSKERYTFRELANKVNKKNLRSRYNKKISPQLIVKILRNPIYCGRIEVPNWGISTKGNHEPLISQELFNKVQFIMDGGDSHKKPRNRDHPDFPLRGVVCGLCGKHISGGWTKGRNKSKRYAYYGCFNKECIERRAIRKIELENHFTKFLLRLTPNEEFSNALEEAIKYNYVHEADFIEKTNKKIGSEIENLNHHKEEVLELRIKNLLTDEEFMAQKEKINFHIRELEMSKENSTTEINLDNAMRFGFQFIKNLPNIWQDLEVCDLRVLRNLLFPENLSYNNESFQTAELSPIYAINQMSDGKKETLVALTGIEPVFTH